MDWKNNSYVISLRATLVQHALILGSIVALLWFLEGVDLLFLKGSLDDYGVQPRTWIGLRNIVLSPFLHAGLRHLFTNTIPFIILGWFVMMRSTREFFLVSVICILVSGAGIWLLGGTNTVHVGISGIIFGFLGYLLARGYFERSAVAIALAVIAVFMYGGMVWGLLPLREGISWLGHLFGFIGGGLTAYLLTRTNAFSALLSTPRAPTAVSKSSNVGIHSLRRTHSNSRRSSGFR